jgi:hypothetical protein
VIWKEAVEPNQGTNLAFAWKAQGKPQKTTFRISVVLAEI